MTDENETSSPLTFPCDFPIKVMGKSTAAFEEKVINIILHTFPTIDLGTVTRRYSKDNNYLALTVVVHAESKAQLDQVYQALTDAEEVLMSL